MCLLATLLDFPKAHFLLSNSEILNVVKSDLFLALGVRKYDIFEEAGIDKFSEK
jgi:hypothetical protein